MILTDFENSLGNKYVNFSYFTKGGMGEIYKGTNISTNNAVILKLIAITDTDEEQLLKREIDISLKLSSPNIAKTFASGKSKIENTDYFYIIQDYYTGGNLRSLIKPNIPIDHCFKMMFEILNGMKEAHKSIIHRDLKPENILVDANNQLYITDFGLAKYINEKTKTKSFKGAGTIPYMSPECWTGDNNTISMDIYSLGLIFFEIISGRLPFNAKTESEWRDFHLFTPLPDITNFRDGIPAKLNQIIHKMCNKRISDRYKTVDEIEISLNEALKINKQEMSEIEKLANIGNIAIQQKKATELRIAQENERRNELIKLYNFHISNLLKSFTDKIQAINNSFEEEKISFYENKNNESSTIRNMKISFNRKSININFSNYDSVSSYEKDRKERSRDYQMQKFGMVMQCPTDSFLKLNNIVLVGLAETEHIIIENKFGFNLLFKKDNDSNYGEWYKLFFSKNINPPVTSFGISLSKFFSDYEKFHFDSFHTTTFKKLTDTDISSLIEKILLA